MTAHRAREPGSDPLTVFVRRVVKPGAETSFETAMRAFVAESSCFPGSEDFHVLRPGPGSPREYTVIHRFADESSRRAFVASAMYREWMARLRELTVDDPEIHEFHGLAGWFTLRGATRHGPPPRPKMALVTFLGVFPLTTLLPPLYGALLPGWHPVATNVVVTATIVALLTWVIMPLLTRAFARWLFAPAKSGRESKP